VTAHFTGGDAPIALLHPIICEDRPMPNSQPKEPRDRSVPTPKGLVELARSTGHNLMIRPGAPLVEAGGGSAPAGAVGTAPPRRGIEEPSEIARTIALVDRAFAFLDLCGFTHFIAANGEHAAIDTLTRFRSLTRDIAVRRGVMVAKWLGDGAMIVGVEVGPTLATAVELIGRYDGSILALRGGFAHGQALMMDGDDYIGRPTNLAARLCQAAHPEELLAVGYPAASIPPWVQVLGVRSVTLPGLGRIRGAQRLGMVPDLELPSLSNAPGRG
jgi:class 3 adenylate cyclase